jgi:hypothetical protein
MCIGESVARMFNFAPLAGRSNSIRHEGNRAPSLSPVCSSGRAIRTRSFGGSLDEGAGWGDCLYAPGASVDVPLESRPALLAAAKAIRSHASRSDYEPDQMDITTPRRPLACRTAP